MTARPAVRLVRCRAGAPAVKVGGIHGLALTKLDVLDGVAQLRICTAYRHFGQTLHHLPGSTQAQAGWSRSTRSWTAGRRARAAPAASPICRQPREVRQALEELVEAPVALLSTSPDRQDTILLRDPFAD